YPAEFLCSVDLGRGLFVRHSPERGRRAARCNREWLVRQRCVISLPGGGYNSGKGAPIGSEGWLGAGCWIEDRWVGECERALLEPPSNVTPRPLLQRLSVNPNRSEADRKFREGTLGAARLRAGARPLWTLRRSHPSLSCLLFVGAVERRGDLL